MDMDGKRVVRHGRRFKWNIGDRVTWESQSRGYRTRKSGVVESIIPAGSMFTLPTDEKRYGKRCRDHESYVVHVPGKGRYWPVVSLLRATEGTED